MGFLQKNYVGFTFPAPIKHCSCFLKFLMPFTLSGTKPLPSNVMLISKLTDAVEAKEKREKVCMC